MQNKKQYIFLLGLALIVIVAATVAFTQERILREGSEVVLKTRPVDPRDLFRGEYVILRYEIEEDEYLQNVAMRLPVGASVFVYLDVSESGVARVGGVSAELDESMTGPWLRGRVAGLGEVRFPSLEQFYVPEGAGTPIENVRSELHVRIAIDARGEARIIELLDGDLTPINPFEYRDKATDAVELEPRPVTAPIE